MRKAIHLGVNIDHVATVRQARGTRYPEPVSAALEAKTAGADGITLHLREDRRHIQPSDVVRIKEEVDLPMNLEMAVNDEMIAFALKVAPEKVCLVPEKREELTTEGGLDVVKGFGEIKAATATLADAGIEVSLFIDPDTQQIDASIACGAPVIELHTGSYADAKDDDAVEAEIEKIQAAATYAASKGLIVNAGHGLYYDNVQEIAQIPELNELNIGHGIVARSLFSGFGQAVMDMKVIMQEARSKEKYMA